MKASHPFEKKILEVPENENEGRVAVLRIVYNDATKKQ